jgi:hypothetical protein
MPTFRFNSERPYYRDGRLMKKVTTQHNIRLSSIDCAILGFSAARLLGRFTLSLLFKRNPYRLP